MTDSLLGRIDPRGKILLALTVSMAISGSRSVKTGLFVLIYGVFLTVLGKVPWREIAKRLLEVNGLLLSLWLTLPFTTGGERLCLWGIPLSVDGLTMAGNITLKSSAMVLILMALLGTSPFHHLLRGLRDLGVSPKLVMLVHFCHRYIQVIKNESVRIHEAASLRGHRQGISPSHLRTTASLVTALLVKSYDRSLRVNDALLLRGFDGTFPSIQESTRTTIPDMAGFGGLVFLFGGCLVL